MDFTSRIEARAAAIPGGREMLEIASRPEVQEDMLRRIRRGMKPVTALSGPLLRELGKDVISDSLKRIAGEAVAQVVEERLNCVRSRGARLVHDDPVFSSGQPFTERVGARPDAISVPPVSGEGGIIAVLLAALSDADLERLADAVSEERLSRAA